jgi:hypothetical protein
MAACRSCKAPIFWALTPNGRRIPLDAEPVDGGNIVLDDPAAEAPTDPRTARVVGKEAQPNLFGDDGPRYTSHFATCPDADSHRKPR